MSSPAERCGGSRFRCKISILAGDTPTTTGFTLIEIVTVMSLIVILAASVLGITGYVQEKGKRSRAEVEIVAMSAALESYKADNGIYPASANTDTLSANANPAPSPNAIPTPNASQNASLDLYLQLSGLNVSQQPVAGMKSYFTFKPQMLGHIPSSSTSVAYICDPWGNSYGYSTIQAANPGSTAQGYNPTYDIWSTANDTTGTAAKWVKNW